MSSRLAACSLSLLAALAAACGGDGGGGPIDASIVGDDGLVGDPDAGSDAAPGELIVTSGVLDDGGLFAPAQTCDGANTSPDLAWTGAPGATLGFAVVLFDRSNDLGHWAIWDLAPGTSGLLADIDNLAAPGAPAGATQARSYEGTFGYRGPCPNTNHMYRFDVIALDVASLPGVDSDSTIDEVLAAAEAHDLAVGSLTSFYPGE